MIMGKDTVRIFFRKETERKGSQVLQFFQPCPGPCPKDFDNLRLSQKSGCIFAKGLRFDFKSHNERTAHRLLDSEEAVP